MHFLPPSYNSYSFSFPAQTCPSAPAILPDTPSLLGGMGGEGLVRLGYNNNTMCQYLMKTCNYIYSYSIKMLISLSLSLSLSLSPSLPTTRIPSSVPSSTTHSSCPHYYVSCILLLNHLSIYASIYHTNYLSYYLLFIFINRSIYIFCFLSINLSISLCTKQYIYVLINFYQFIYFICLFIYLFIEVSIYSLLHVLILFIYSPISPFPHLFYSSFSIILFHLAYLSYSPSLFHFLFFLSRYVFKDWS